MAPWRRPRGERLAESGRAQIRAVRGGRDTGEVPAGPVADTPASHRAGDTRGISPPTYPCALERSTMSGKSRERSPSTDISDPAGSRETTERPGSCRTPVDVAKPDRRAAESSAQRWQIRSEGNDQRREDHGRCGHTPYLTPAADIRPRTPAEPAAPTAGPSSARRHRTRLEPTITAAGGNGRGVTTDSASDVPTPQQLDLVDVVVTTARIAVTRRIQGMDATPQ
jgi:hypothetical protein